MSIIRPLIAGNWKMNGTVKDLSELRAIASGLSSDLGRNFDALICPPATLISRAADLLQEENLYLGAQDCHFASSGAYTGDMSAAMVKDAGADFVILGHSERRANYHETDALINRKIQAAWQETLNVVLCIGETSSHRETGQTLDIIGTQIDGALPTISDTSRLTIAYEPIWAIGTGKIPTLDQINETHSFIRDKIKARFGSAGDQIRLLYGGSVKPDNAEQILALPDVNGALIGGASLKAQDFLAICAARSIKN